MVLQDRQVGLATTFTAFVMFFHWQAQLFLATNHCGGIALLLMKFGLKMMLLPHDKS